MNIKNKENKSLLAPAFPNDDSFYARFFSEVSSIRDQAGRPLHEVDFRDDSKDSSFKKCPFHDSRKGYLMNNEALRQIVSEWSDIVDGISYFSSLFNGKSRDLKNAWRVSMVTMFAPLYLLHRGENKILDGDLDTAVSGVFKIMLDVPTTIDLMLLSQDVSFDQKPSDIQKFADQELILVNGEYVCAGSPQMINNVLDILYSDISKDFNEKSKWLSFFNNQNEFLHFSYLMAAQYICSQIYQMTTAVVMEVLAQKRNFSYSKDMSPLSAYEKRRRYMLKKLMQPDAPKRAFNNLIELVNDPADWGSSMCSTSSLNDLEDLSVEFIAKVKSLSAAEIAKEYESYQAFIQTKLISIQTEIVESISSTTIFNHDLRFVKEPKNHPFHILTKNNNAI